MEPKKKTSSKCGDVLHKGSSFQSFISLLMIVALFLRMESIDRKTEMNELRIASDDRSIDNGFDLRSWHIPYTGYAYILDQHLDCKTVVLCFVFVEDAKRAKRDPRV